MNRRIPNGTYGGVGGRRLAAFSYPILYKIASLCSQHGFSPSDFAMTRMPAYIAIDLIP
jgi:hypothetical protein